MPLKSRKCNGTPRVTCRLRCAAPTALWKKHQKLHPLQQFKESGGWQNDRTVNFDTGKIFVIVML